MLIYFTNLLPTANHFTSFHLFLPVSSMATYPLLVSHNTFVVWGIISLGVFIMICFIYRNYFILVFKTFIMNAYFINSLNVFSVFNSRGSCAIIRCFLYFVLLWQFFFCISIDVWSWNSQWRERKIMYKMYAYYFPKNMTHTWLDSQKG